MRFDEPWGMVCLFWACGWPPVAYAKAVAQRLCRKVIIPASVRPEYSQLLNTEWAGEFVVAVANLLRQQPQRFSPFRFVESAEYLIQLRVEALGKNETKRMGIPWLKVFQSNDHRNVLPPREVQEFLGHRKQG